MRFRKTAIRICCTQEAERERRAILRVLMGARWCCPAHRKGISHLAWETDWE